MSAFLKKNSVLSIKHFDEKFILEESKTNLIGIYIQFLQSIQKKKWLYYFLCSNFKVVSLLG